MDQLVSPCLALLACSVPALAQSPVFIVDAAGGPGSTHTSIGDAITAAPDGAIVLVRPGNYVSGSPFFPEPPTSIQAKSVTVVADGPGSVLVSGGGFAVGPSGPQDSVVLRGVLIQGGSMSVSQAQGPVWLEEIRNSGVSPNDALTLSVQESSAVAALACEFLGLFGTFSGAAGCYLSDSALSSYDSTFVGGGFGFSHGPFTFLPDVDVDGDSSVFLSGAAQVLFDVELDANATASIAGVSLGPLDNDPNVELLSTTSRGFTASRTVREGQAVVFDFRGEPGEIAILNVSGSSQSLLVPGLGGVGLVQLPLPLLKFAGTIPSGGLLQTTLGVPANFLPPGTGATYFSQGTFGDLVAGSIQIGGASMTVVLDSSF